MPKGNGMAFEDVRRRLKRIYKTEKEGKVKNYQLKANLEKSLKGQVERRDGREAVKELTKEFAISGAGIGFSGKDLCSCGFGKGSRPTAKEGFIKIDDNRWRKTY